MRRRLARRRVRRLERRLSTSRTANLRRIGALAWPVLIGQLAVIGFSTVDTLLVARASPEDLAALSVGSAAYVTVFIGMMGVVLAIGPIVGQLFGGGQRAQAGRQLHQAAWVALGLAALGALLLAFPFPFLALAQATPDMESRIRGYLLALAVALPAALLMQAYRGFNNAISRPKAVMALQVGGFALKVPLSTLLVFGAPGLGLPALGVLGCGMATAIVMWLQAGVAWAVLRHDRFYAPFELLGRGLDRPDRRAIGTQLRLGVPMGLSILIEVSAFSLMAVFIARLGVTASAGHQIAANLASVMFMLPLSLSSATMTLVAQRVGASDLPDARRLAWHGLQGALAVSVTLATVVWLGRHAVVRLYTADAAIAAVAVPLLAWVALLHVADAAQALASFVLRAYRIATVPMLVYAGSLWGLGLVLGYALAFDTTGATPAAWRGPAGFWLGATAGLVVAALALCWLMARTVRRSAAAVSVVARPGRPAADAG
ncbi:MAG: MATE family efflux transporter [Rubrivivax sp.]|nr:MATE family efflux transporter [Rubrivivax sp.]